jgi:hypothetical protein
MGDCSGQLLEDRRLTLSAFSHFHRRLLGRHSHLLSFEQRIVDAFWNRTMPTTRTSCGARGQPSDTRLLVSCQQRVEGLTPSPTRKLWSSMLDVGITFASSMLVIDTP